MSAEIKIMHRLTKLLRPHRFLRSLLAVIISEVVTLPLAFMELIKDNAVSLCAGGVMFVAFCILEKAFSE